MKQSKSYIYNCAYHLVALSMATLFFSCKKETPQPTPPLLEIKAIHVHIHTEQAIPVNQKVTCNLLFVEAGDSLKLTAKIKRRGGYSIAYDKHSYTLDLKEDISIGGLPADDDWILNANYIDKSFMRHTLSYELFKKMNPAKNISSQYKYIEVYLNKQYNGLYVLMERLDRSTLMIDPLDTAAFIFKDPPIFRENLTAFVPQDIDNYHQQNYPDIKDFDKTSYIEALRNFLLEATDSLFSHKIDTIFDINTIIDWHLLLLYTNNGDGILKNFYLYKKNKTSLIQIAPWDYDHSFGRHGDNSLNLENPLRPERAILLKRLLSLKWYTTQLKKRWLQLNNQQIFGVQAVNLMVDQYAEGINHLAETNFEVWPTDVWPFKDANNLKEETLIIKEYLNIRQGQLNVYFKAL